MIDLLKRREELGITQTELAVRIGTTRQCVSQIERRVCRPSIATAKKLAEILNLDWADFFDKD